MEDSGRNPSAGVCARDGVNEVWKAIDILEVLEHIDPSLLDYQDWVNVGMALKEEGCMASDWDDWSRRDAARYHAGECYRKWDGFQGSPSPVTGGTIVQLAKDQGWAAGSRRQGTGLGRYHFG